MPSETEDRRGIRHGLRTSKMPPGAGYIVTATNQFRRTLEDAVLAIRGEVTLPEAAWINTAVRWERHAQLAQKWLSDEAGSLSAADRLAYSRDIARASSERDRCIKALDLDPRQQRPADYLDMLAPQTPQKNYLPSDDAGEKKNSDAEPAKATEQK